MSVRQALLALLEEGPMYGYQLRASSSGVRGRPGRSTSGRSTRPSPGWSATGWSTGSGADGEGHVVYEVTEAGRDEVATWFTTPVARTPPPRDELAIKLALAVTVPGVDVGTVIQQQRTRHHVRAAGLHPAQARPAAPRPRADDLAWGLVLESLIFDAEAEVRWLDHCEARLRRAAVDEGRRRDGRGRPDRRPTPRERTADERRAPARHRHPHPRRGRDRGARAQGGHLRRARRRAGRRHGPVRLRQVDAAHPGRRARRADDRHRVASRAPTSARSARRAGRGCGVRRSATSSRTST